MRVLRLELLDERAAARDVEHLHAPADTQQRQVALERAAGQRELEAVAPRPHPDRLLRARLAVEARADVAAAGDEQAVEQVERLAGRRRRSRRRRAGSRLRARPGERHRVAPRREVRLRLPDRPARRLERGRDADHGPPPARSQPLEAPEALPVGDRGLECLELDPRPVQVVVDDLLRRKPRGRRRSRRTGRVPRTSSAARAACRTRRRCPRRAARARARCRSRAGPTAIIAASAR